MHYLCTSVYAIIHIHTHTQTHTNQWWSSFSGINMILCILRIEGKKWLPCTGIYTYTSQTTKHTPVLETVCIAVIILLHQVAKGFRWQGYHIVQDHTTVAAWCQNQLVMEMVESHTPNPAEISDLSGAQLTMWNITGNWKRRTRTHDYTVVLFCSLPSFTFFFFLIG